MAQFEWKEPINAVHGRLWKGVGAAKRKSANNKGEQPNFSVMYGKRTTEPSADELANRLTFKTIVKKMAQRRKDAVKRVQDAQAFRAQTTYKTFTKYLFEICKAEVLAAQDNG